MSSEHCELGASLKNISKTNCLPLGRTNMIVVDPTGEFSFTNRGAMKDITNWNNAIKAKLLFVFPLIETEESADVDPVFEELANSRPKVTERKKATNWQSLLPACMHANLRSFDNRKVRIFEITESNYVKSVNQADGKQKGQQGILTVDLQTLADSSNTAKTPYSFRYIGTEYDQNPSDALLDFAHEDLNGVIDVSLTEILTSTSSLINIQVKKLCSGQSVTNLILADFVVVDSLGASVTVTSATYVPSKDAYELASSAAFSNGDVVSLNGVIDQTTIFYEAPVSEVISTI